MQHTTFVTKTLAAASSNSVGTFSSAGVYTAIAGNLDTARRIIVWGSTSIQTTITIYGLEETGSPISETVIGSSVTGTAVQTTQDFIRVTNVSLLAGVNSTTGYLGTSSQGGTAWKQVDRTKNPIAIGFALAPTSTSIVASFEYSIDPPAYNPVTGTWTNPYNTSGPPPTISSLGSSVTAYTVGNISTPINAWRVTLTSSSSSAGTINASVIQSG